jgi:hypothetical protein
MTPDADSPLSPASAALLAAVDEALTGETPYPERAAFVDADQPDAGHQIARAAADGRAVVLCSADGTRQVLYPRSPAAA